MSILLPLTIIGHALKTAPVSQSAHPAYSKVLLIEVTISLREPQKFELESQNIPTNQENFRG